MNRRSIGRAPRWVHVFRSALCVTIAISGAACSTPDASAALAQELPQEVLAYLLPDTVRQIEIRPGVVYWYLWSDRGPWAVHVVRADLAGQCDLEFGVLQAEPRESGGQGHERVTSMVRRSADRVLVAVNADFFTAEGTTVGTEIVDGRVVAARARPTFAWRLGSEPWIGIAGVTDDATRLRWPVDRTGGDGLTEAVGGFPDLIDQGRRVGDLEISARPSFAALRHPRTGIGYDPARGQAWVVVVDGRQTPHSAGMTLPEFAALFEAMGASEALNLDGGGSSVMVLGGVAVSRPSDVTGERAVVNALALIEHPRGCLAGYRPQVTPRPTR